MNWIKLSIMLYNFLNNYKSYKNIVIKFLYIILYELNLYKNKIIIHIIKHLKHIFNNLIVMI